MTRHVRGRAAASLLALALAACASLPTVAPRPTAVGESFDVRGRFSARHGDEGLAGQFSWTHAASGDTLLFSAPTGQALARITGDAKVVRLERSDGSVESSPDWGTLTSKALGVPVPVHALSYWIRALPTPDAPHDEERDTQGRVIVLRQGGWEIDYGYAAGPLPARLRLTYPEIELRLVLDAWS